MNTERILPKMIFVNWRDKIDSRAVENGHTRTRKEQFRREHVLLQEELADRERALRDTRIWSIQKLEELKRYQEFSRRRMGSSWSSYERCPVAILAQELSWSKWTLWQSQTTCFTRFLLSSWSKCLQPSFLCFRASLSFWSLPIARVKMQCTLLCLDRRLECWFS